MATTFDFSSQVVADTDMGAGPPDRWAYQTVGGHTLSATADQGGWVVMDEAEFAGVDLPGIDGAALVKDLNDANTTTLRLALDSGKLFDLTSLRILDINLTVNAAFRLTTSKGSVDGYPQPDSGLWAWNGSHPYLMGVTWVDITMADPDHMLLPAIDNIVLDNIIIPPSPPSFFAANVNGATLTMYYADSDPLDALNPPDPAAFAVTVAGAPVAVSAVHVDPDMGTVTLTLASAVVAGQAVSVTYTDPTAGDDANAIQDEDGTDAATLAPQTVANSTLAPAIVSASFDAASGLLSLHGADLVPGSAIDLTKLVLRGEGGATYALTSVGATASSPDSVTVTLNAADSAALATILNKNGATATGGTGFNLAAAAGWAPGGGVEATNTLTVSNVAAPTIQGATFNEATGILTVSGANFTVRGGALNDIDASRFTVTGAGGATWTLSDTADVDIVSGTGFALNLGAADRAALAAILDKSGTSSRGGTTYNLAAQEDWAAGADAAVTIADLTGNGIDATLIPDLAAPVFDSASVNGASLVLAYLDAKPLDAAHAPAAGAFAVSADGAAVAVYSVTVDADARTVTLSLATAILAGQAVSVAYTDPSAGNDAAAIQDETGNDAASLPAQDVTNATLAPTIAAASYDAASGQLAISGANLVAGTAIDLSRIVIGGEGGATHRLGTAGASAASASEIVVALDALDVAALNQILNRNGASATGGAAFELAADALWTAGASADAANALAVANVAVPAVDGAAYDAASGVLLVSGTGFLRLDGGANDIVAGKFTLTGANGATHTLADTADVDILSGTAFSLTLGANDRSAVELLFDAAGTGSAGGTLYNLAAGEDWAAGADAAVVTADLLGNGIAVTLPDASAPQFASATVNGRKLVLAYQDSGALDATHVPPAGAFTVTAGGVAIAVAAVAVDGMARTVTLTLARAVANGQAVTVAYTDPSAGNDSAALQDMAGNDAPSLAAQAVVNNTPPPAPKPEPEPAPNPGGGNPPPVTVIDGVPVRTKTVTNPDGSTTTTTVIPVVPQRDGQSGPADIPLVSNGGANVLGAQVPTGFGLAVSGPPAPQTPGNAAGGLLGALTALGSGDTAGMGAGASGFLQDLPAGTPVVVRTLTPSAANGAAPSQPLVIEGSPPAPGNPVTALVIDTRGLPPGSRLHLENVEFALIVGEANVGGGAGSQTVYGDGARQTIVLGADDDELHGGGGDDTVGSAGGDDRIFGDAGNDLVFGGSGNDWIDGGSGRDTAALASSASSYRYRVEDGQLRVTDRVGADGSDVVAGVEQLRFAGAATGFDTVSTIARLYDIVFGRSPDQAGAAFWEHAVDRGISLADVAVQLVQSAEGQSFAKVDDAEYVSMLYLNALGRGAGAAEAAYWIGQLESCRSHRGDVLLGFANSEERLQRDADRSVTLDFNDSDIATIVRLYDVLFDRRPDQAGLNYWLAQREDGMSMHDIAADFFNSAEAQARYGGKSNADVARLVLENAFERAPAAQDVIDWAGLLDGGVIDHAMLLVGVAGSDQMAELVGVNTSIATL